MIAAGNASPDDLDHSALEPAKPPHRYQREQPGELIHIDIKKLGRFRTPATASWASVARSGAIVAQGGSSSTSARPSAKPAAAPNDELPVRLRWLILVALTVLSWALIGGIAIAVVAVVDHLDW
jgi:hypothetical protein